MMVENQSAGMGHAEIFSVNSETVQMEVTPAKGDLESIVQIRNCMVGAKEQSAPNHGADPAQTDMKLINLRSGHDPGRLSKRDPDWVSPQFAPVSWILGGSSPVFIREEGQLYEGGPIWRTEQNSPAFTH